MNVQPIVQDRKAALELWKKYQAHRTGHYTPIDAEIARLAKMIAGGKVMVNALASIAAAGLDEAGQPKLAIGRADQKYTFCHLGHDGSAIMFAGDLDRWNRHPWPRPQMAASLRFDFPKDTWPRIGRSRQLQALIPHIPPDIRPRRGLQSYHVLFEPTWERAVPIDPMLVRRIGKSNLWIVLGAWELTEIERAVLAGRLLS